MKSYSYSVVLSGEAGQGLKSIESICMTLFQKSGLYAFLSKELMSRVRGGNNTTQIRITSEPVGAYVEHIDLLIVLSKDGLDRLIDRIGQETVIVGQEAHIFSQHTRGIKKSIPIEESVKSLGSSKYASTVICGLLCNIFSCDKEIAHTLIAAQFSSKGEEVVEKNLKAFQMGYNLAPSIGYTCATKAQDKVKERYPLNGSHAVGIGAILGGCNFIASYPMSPSTAVLSYLASKAHQYGIVVEQAEDEIAAINMGLGAWYAGARAMVTTSGGGFALMTEGLSLAGITESPMVIHLAQRPGPATGLPTRTEQGDFNLALYGGHGDFLRVIFAPRTYEEAIRLSAYAFEVADTYQVPVIVLTDQFFLDSEGSVEIPDMSTFAVHPSIVTTTSSYTRYQYTESGISPRGIAGNGEGFVCVDSDEHTEEGRITESFIVRKEMMDKRSIKLDALVDLSMELIGDEEYATLIICWGSTYSVVKEALSQLQIPKLAAICFSQVFPIPLNAIDYLYNAEELILLEHNKVGQFGDYLQQQLGLIIQKRILKYDGAPFSLEYVIKKIGELL